MAVAKALSFTQTSIGQKTLVAVSGLVLYGFVFGHALGNLQVFLGRETFNEYAAFLHSMPHALWLARGVLLLALVTHVTMVARFLIKAKSGRKGRYKIDAPIAKDQSILHRFARQTMPITGLLIFAYIAFHLVHLTIGEAPSLFFHRGWAYENLVYGMRVPWVAGFYIFANLLLGMHLFHGSHAVFQSLGLRHPNWDRFSRPSALGVAALVVATNVIIPIACVSRIAGGELPDDPATYQPADASDGASSALAHEH